MEIRCDRALLTQAMQVVQNVVAARTPIPILQNVKLLASAKELQIFGSDLEVGIRYSLPLVSSQGEGAAVVPADKVANFVREMSDREITIKLEASGAKIEGATSKLSVAGSDLNGFPAFPEFDEKDEKNVTRLNVRDLVEMAQKTVFAASRESSRYALMGVLVETHGDEIRMVASDGKRLAYAKKKIEKETGAKIHIVVPPKALQLLEKSAASKGMLGPVAGHEDEAGAKGKKGKEQKEAVVHLHCEENQVKMLADGIMIFSRLVEGSFPNYEAAIPKQNDKKVQLPTNELLAAMRRLSILATDWLRTVTLHLSKNNLLLTSRERGVGDVREEMKVEYDGDEVRTSFNADYFLDMLRVVGAPEVVVELKDTETATVVKAKPDLVYLIMPLTLPEEGELPVVPNPPGATDVS